MAKVSIALILLSMACAKAPAPVVAPIAFDHVWIVVSPGAPERVMLERAGIHVAPTVSRHDGQGTASVMAEFQNAFLELMWPDETVSIAPGSEKGAEKFRNRMLWRTTGWSPIGLVFHYTGSSPSPVPLPAWKISLPWMAPGSSMEMLTPRDDTSSPSLSIHPRPLPVPPNANEQEIRVRDGNTDALIHPLGLKRVTAVRLIEPAAYKPIDAVTWLHDHQIINVDNGSEWTVELTFDGASRGLMKDFRPDLPLLIRY
ncbi:MAG TPA: hypothetical protein VN380_24315 [Thermoanaerobaculia bacterium]|jgi:hypothetical protein|nr:hypothetical protein [Thermoanaerobaculia bacterium]